MNKHDILDRFNKTVPLGTPVRFWPGVREGVGREGKTRSAAELLGGHTPVVWIEDWSGCIALTHVQRPRRREGTR